MPNWCTNRVEIVGEEVELDQIEDMLTERDEEDDERRVTFAKLIPMPEILHRTADGSTKIDNVLVRTWMAYEDDDGNRIDRLPTEEEAAELREIGHASWYSWAMVNWGTKWDACETVSIDRDGDTLRLVFDTAWSPPQPVLDKVKEVWPNVDIEGYWEEEGGGSGALGAGPSNDVLAKLVV